MKNLKQTLAGIAFCVAVAAAASNAHNAQDTELRFVPAPYPNVKAENQLFKAGPAPTVQSDRKSVFVPRPF